MKKKYSHIGLISSLAIHGSLFAGAFFMLGGQSDIPHFSDENSLSMEMVAALLEQPQVAVSPDPVSEEVKEIEEVKAENNAATEQEVKPELDAIADPTLKPKKEKPKDKPKEEKNKKQNKPNKKEERLKPEDKPKDKPKKERPKLDNKPIKALEKGNEAKQGIVAKAIPGAVQGEKSVTGVIGGQKGGSLNSTSTTGSINGSGGGNANEISAYRAALQRALQRRANNSYPQREKMMRKTGTVTIKFTVTSSGKLANVAVVKSSGNTNLDTAAVKSAEGVQVSPPPAGFPSQLSVPVKFSIE